MVRSAGKPRGPSRPAPFRSRAWIVVAGLPTTASSHAPTYATRLSIFRRRSSLDASDATMSPPTSDSLASSRRGMAA